MSQCSWPCEERARLLMDHHSMFRGHTISRMLGMESTTEDHENEASRIIAEKKNEGWNDQKILKYAITTIQNSLVESILNGELRATMNDVKLALVSVERNMSTTNPDPILIPDAIDILLVLLEDIQRNRNSGLSIASDMRGQIISLQNEMNQEQRQRLYAILEPLNIFSAFTAESDADAAATSGTV